MDLKRFWQEHEYIDFSSPVIIKKAGELFSQADNDVEKARIAYGFVRDEIPHSFDIKATIITAKASDVLIHKTGICHAKANLLAALLRAEGIPAGMCFQHITLAEDDKWGYAAHCYNAVFLNGKWIKLDARGNTKGRNAQFSLDEPILAYPNRKEYDEYFWKGIYASPHMDTIKMLDNAKTSQDIIDNIPDYVHEIPDIFE